MRAFKRKLERGGGSCGAFADGWLWVFAHLLVVLVYLLHAGKGAGRGN